MCQVLTRFFRQAERRVRGKWFGWIARYALPLRFGAGLCCQLYSTLLYILQVIISSWKKLRGRKREGERGTGERGKTNPEPRQLPYRDT